MELNDLFDYGYKIYQNLNYFKFSIDSVLLSEFARVYSNDKVLDLCSGNCAIPMILTSIHGNISIDAVEIQKEIYDLGLLSIEYNNIHNINFINEDVKKLDSILKNNSYDIITCNPPYYEFFNKKNISNDKVKSNARHEILINLEELIKIASILLKNNGRFYFVHVPYRLSEIVLLLSKYNFGLKKMVPVYGTKNVDATFMLFECVKNAKSYVKVSKPIFINDYSSFKGIFKEDI